MFFAYGDTQVSRNSSGWRDYAPRFLGKSGNLGHAIWLAAGYSDGYVRGSTKDGKPFRWRSGDPVPAGVNTDGPWNS